MSDTKRAYWLADKIPACGDYGHEASVMLRQQADELAATKAELEAVRKERDEARLIARKPYCDYQDFKCSEEKCTCGLRQWEKEYEALTGKVWV